MDILGVDNVLFIVGDLNEAAGFYQELGFQVKFRLDVLDICVMSVGFELPGLILRKAGVPKGPLAFERAHFWVEVPDTRKCLEELREKGIALLREPMRLPTGLLVEVADPWGNVVGFTDHLVSFPPGRPSAAGKSKQAASPSRRRAKGKRKK